MKRMLILVLSVIMTLSMSLTGIAASFVSSPSGNPAPTIDGFDFGDGDCQAELVVTPYSEKDTLPDDGEAAMLAAYNSIKNTNDVSALNADLAALAKSKEIKGTNLAVSDLFDVSYINCDPSIHPEHGPTSVRLRAETLDNFVALLHYYNGAWVLVENATVKNGVLSFQVESLSPFAIVVDASPDSPPTHDSSNAYLFAAIAALSAAAMIICFKKSRKEETN